MENIIFDRIRREIDTNDIVLYMKGTAVFPLCGFSAAVAQILSQLGVPFRDVNVLEDNVLRQGIKDSPTGRPSRNSISRASSSAAATSCAKCTRRESYRPCCKTTASRWWGSR